MRSGCAIVTCVRGSYGAGTARMPEWEKKRWRSRRWEKEEVVVVVVVAREKEEERMKKKREVETQFIYPGSLLTRHS